MRRAAPVAAIAVLLGLAEPAIPAAATRHRSESSAVSIDGRRYVPGRPDKNGPPTARESTFATPLREAGEAAPIVLRFLPAALRPEHTLRMEMPAGSVTLLLGSIAGPLDAVERAFRSSGWAIVRPASPCRATVVASYAAGKEARTVFLDEAAHRFLLVLRLEK